MHNIPENPQLTLARLYELSIKINDNTATVKDYEDLSHFLSSTHSEDFLLNNIKKYDFINFKNFIYYRAQSKKLKHMHFEESFIMGMINQCIKILRDFITVK